MSPAPERKLKQALLPFNKKRKLENEVAEDDTKCKKTCHNTVSEVSNNSGLQDLQEVAEINDVTKNQEEIDDISGKSCSNDQKSENTADKSDTSDEKMAVEIPSLNNVADKNASELNITEDLISTVPTLSNKNNDDSLDDTLSVNSANVSMTEHTKSTVPENLTKNNDFEQLSNDPNVTINESIEKHCADKNVTPKKLTPKQLQKRKETELKRLERERQKQEKEQKKQEIKEQKEKKRLAELEIKHAEKKQKEEEKRAKEEERRQKEEERKAKEEERRQKALAKEEERRQKEEEKRQKEEHEKKVQKKTAAIFSNFFLRSKTKQSNVKTENTSQPESTTFMPFQVKDDMKLAPVNRVSLSPEMKYSLDQVLNKKQGLDKEFLYLAVLKSASYKPGHSDDTWPLNRIDSDEDRILCVDNPVKCKTSRQNRPKLLQFGENRRPAYWGTWRKNSKSINPRRPWAQDTVYFDYDFDSDDEWVEEEPGESLHGSDDEKESEDEYEVDNELFVPHGYLSDEEGGNDEDVAERSPKSQKLKLNLLEKEFEAEMKEKTRKLTPRVFGCKWISNNIFDTDQTSDDVENLLLSFRAVWDDTRSPFHPKTESENITPQNTPSIKGKLRSDFPDSLLPCLIKLVHGNKNSASKLAEEFSLYVLNQEVSLKLSKTCITTKIKEISSWVPNLGCWIVMEEVRNQHNLGELSYQENSWKYVSNIEMHSLVKKQKLASAEKQTINPPAPIVTTPTTSQKNDTSSIAKFLKVLTPEQKRKQLISLAVEKKTEIQSSSSSSLNVDDGIKKEPTSGNVQAKKRAVLFTLDKSNPKKSFFSNSTSKTSSDAEKTSAKDTVATDVDLCSDNSAPAKEVPAPDKVLTEKVVIIHQEDARKQNINYSSSENLEASSVSSHEVEENSKPIEKSINSRSFSNFAELNSPNSPRVSENIVRIQQGKKYARLFTIGKINKE